MESCHQQINMCKISEVTVKDLSKINEIENQLNLNKTKLNFFNQTSSNKNFKFIKLVSENSAALLIFWINDFSISLRCFCAAEKEA